jgi:hypothetical protein
MGRRFSRAVIESMIVEFTDKKGRRASIEFEDDVISLHRLYPARGKAAVLSYDQLFDLVAVYNPDFFKASKPRRQPKSP